ncbi:DUF6029 family protein [Nonlabens tegetincola]|uniref:DUF6029 family protein n=1 Tax=Nonlabens tegetincola TaxID=323273 RepID=UPI0030C7A42D
MKNYLLLAALLIAFNINAQDGTFSGGLESNSQWYQDDDGILNGVAPQDQFRSNNYLKLQYTQGKFTVGAQYELYQPSPLLGYFEGFEGNGIATYFATFKHKDLEITAGNFYDQFGSGLIFRTWEDHTLGIDNSIRGIRVNYAFNDYLEATGFIGNQRTGFELSEGTVQGINSEFDLGELLNTETGINIGASYVGRYQVNTSADPDFPSTVNAYSMRGDLYFDKFNLQAEYVYKEPDAVIVGGTPLLGNYFDGRALLLNLGYSIPGLGINTTLRATENMGFFSDREQAGNPFLNQTINFVPGYTKQSSYMVRNIYVYNPQVFLNPDEEEAGEIGGQLDVVHTAKPGSLFGFKYGTTYSLNYSNWAGLDSSFDVPNNDYDASLFSRGKKYFEEFSFQLNTKFSKALSAKFTAAQTYYNAKNIEGGNLLDGQSELNGTAFVADLLYDLGKGRSVRFDAQHLSADADRGNWAAATLEYAFNTSLSLYVADLYNYEDTEIHYYSVGGSYTKGRTRVALNYGRQRGGLICVGGVCRFVPENTGLTLNLTTNF